MDTTYRKTWTITLAKNALFTDVDILSQGYSRVGAAGDNVRRSDRIATDTLSANDAHIIKRKCDHRANDIRQVLSKFIYNAQAAASVTDAADSSDIVITLSVPSECENTILAAITDLCHDYIVNGALVDWYADIGAGNTEIPAQRAKECLARIRELIYQRPLP